MNENLIQSQMHPHPYSNWERHLIYENETRKEQIMNPEPILLEVATAIKHRCISTTHRWQVIYYHDRICCVPSHENVPPEIVLCEFSEREVQDGFTKRVWTELGNRITKVYKELHK